MTDLTPNERAALFAALDKNQWNPEAIWRAARAYQAEQDGKVCDEIALSHARKHVGDAIICGRCGSEWRS